MWRSNPLDLKTIILEFWHQLKSMKRQREVGIDHIAQLLRDSTPSELMRSFSTIPVAQEYADPFRFTNANSVVSVRLLVLLLFVGGGQSLGVSNSPDDDTLIIPANCNNDFIVHEANIRDMRTVTTTDHRRRIFGHTRVVEDT
jgi:hypothetical protein